MRRVRALAVTAIAAISVALLATAAGSALAAKVRVGKLILTADGGFAPRVLPRHEYVPIHFQGYADIETTDGSPPPALQRVRLDFDRDGKLTTAGLAVCDPQQLAGATPAQARRRCHAAAVGTGHVEATIGLPGRGRVDLRAPLSIFNGPRQSGNPTVLAHSQATFPIFETYVIVVPIERRRGVYGYRATIDVPPIAGGLGALTHIDGKIGRRYHAGGTERSYVSARCSDGILQTFGLASFADGTVVSGSLFKGCHAVP
jgi:hypothetical protein